MKALRAEGDVALMHRRENASRHGEVRDRGHGQDDIRQRRGCWMRGIIDTLQATLPL